jgi:hypothetical protein
MKFVYFILVLFKYLKAIVLHEKNQIAYLHYLYASHFGFRSPLLNKKNRNTSTDSKYKAADIEDSTNTTSFLLE